MEHGGKQFWILEQSAIDEALLAELQRGLDRQSWELDALDSKASALLSTAGIIVTILLALLRWWFSDPGSEMRVCPVAFVIGILWFVAVVGVAIWALRVRRFWRPIYATEEEINEYRSLDRDELIGQLLKQYIGAHEMNQDTKVEKISKVNAASAVLLAGLLYLAILAGYTVWSS